MAYVGLGLVGYYQFIRGYPLGPELKERLDSITWPEHQVDIKEMNWGPVAIVQDFQASKASYDRMVLVAAVARGGKTGAVTCRRWIGGELGAMAIQQRIFEAVTGIISVDNLLVIGEHFGIWPQELIVIEVEIPDDSIGNLVMEELKINRRDGRGAIIGQRAMSPVVEKIVERIVDSTRLAVGGGVAGMTDLLPLSVDDLNPPVDLCHNHLIEVPRSAAPIH